VNDLVARKPWLPYAAPFAVYLGFLLLQTRWEGGLLWLYPLKTVATAATLIYFWPHYLELRRGAPGRAARPGALALGAAVGLVAIIAWIAIDPLYPGLTPLLFRRPVEVFDPGTIQPDGLRCGFRVAGAVLVVPLMEEVFWRGFLIRWLIKEDFRRVPLGTFTAHSFIITVVFFGLEHEQWLAGLICGALYNWVLYRTRSLWACVVAHAVSNAVLAGWVLATQQWKFW